jgi:hypothetical protein
MTRLLLLSLLGLCLAGCGGHAATIAQPVPIPADEPVQAHAAAAQRAIRKDFAAHLVPNAYGVGPRELRLNGPTLEAWSTLRLTRAGMRDALALCERMYHRYVVASLGSLAGQAAVYSRGRVLMTASLRYKARCYALTKVAP